ncbi:hypothetical Protein YC6258_01134 [Gynuella sunshinyii YC6258]|uniref:Uncharacterized protein n=1 Tax=Gynuella sunshinyii YC6258 TaxID=1445510 RepID=A0A0C5VF55_9GAMM|nr:hypothetical Protein YC6258_01134 [Gynuella sunshinyii YC6258]
MKQNIFTSNTLFVCYKAPPVNEILVLHGRITINLHIACRPPNNEYFTGYS